MSEPAAVTRKRGSRLFSLPSTSVGKWCAGLLLLSLVVVLLNTLIVMPITEQQTGLELPQAVFNYVVFLCVVSAGISGLFALVAKREHSWTVLLSVLVLIVVVGLLLSDFVTPG